MSSDCLILCHPAALSSRDSRWRHAKTVDLRLGKAHGNVNLRITDLTSRMVANLPDVAVDLVEIATYVYCADQALPRGGTRSFEYGQKWRRRIRFEIPVRRPDIWSSGPVMEALQETLGFLSDDDYEFAFVKMDTPPPMESYLEFDTSTPSISGVEEVLLFSGGIDSLGGAIKETLQEGRKVALVSHSPVGKIGTYQKDLVAAINQELKGKDIAPFHVPVLINKQKRLGVEHTQRTRSFLYAAIGSVVARLFGLDRIRFYENGVISLNLPISPQVLGGRASRTTHPKVLEGFSKLFSLVFQRAFAVENPFLWKTKTDVLLDIKAAGYSRLCARSVSCSHTWEMTVEQPHCGHCSQCVDRRLVTMAAGYDNVEDPVTRYKIDALTDSLAEPEDITLAESYVRTVTEIEEMQNAVQFCTKYGEVSRVVNHLGGRADSIAQKVFDLYASHARQICSALDQAGRAAIPRLRRGNLPSKCLLSIAYSGRGRTMLETPHGETPDFTVTADVVYYHGRDIGIPAQGGEAARVFAKLWENVGQYVQNKDFPIDVPIAKGTQASPNLRDKIREIKTALKKGVPYCVKNKRGHGYMLTRKGKPTNL